MISSFGSWWQKIKQHRVAIGVVAIVLVVVVIALIIAGYQFDWTGFNRYIGPQLKANQQYRPEKTLWDWLQLLIIPLVLAVAALLFNRATTRTEQKIALDKQGEDLLQVYLDRMSELLLKHKLRQSAVDAEVRNVARVRTITILFQLDAKRIGYVFAFLRESKLMVTGSNSSIVSLEEADLRKINLSQANLFQADLRKAFLVDANLCEAYLSRANLSGTNLSGANLSQAKLSEADLSEATLFQTELSEADLSEATLFQVNLIEATLNKAIFRKADLRKANLSEADLSGADLSEANLSEADLSGADLSEANLSGTNLTRASVTTEQLEKAKPLKGTTMPDGGKNS